MLLRATRLVTVPSQNKCYIRKSILFYKHEAATKFNKKMQIKKITNHIIISASVHDKAR